jgi:hypothetical protein
VIRSKLQRRSPDSRRARFNVEPLERRVMLCSMADFSASTLALDGQVETARGAARAQAGVSSGPTVAASEFFNINWTNRGGPGNDSDNFASIFGARAAAARNVVEAVMQMWEHVIVDMHDQGGRNSIDVDVYMDADDTGFGGGARLVETEYGFPVRGDIEIRNGTAGTADRGWFIDDSPLESGEFTGNIVNAFAGDALATGLAAGKRDLFTVVCAEMIHLLGITSEADTFWADPGFAAATDATDNGEGGGIGELYYVDFPQLRQLMTTNNGGARGTNTHEPLHTSPGVLDVGGGVGLIYGSEDAGNAAFEPARRYLPPNNVALMLNIGYGYEIREPEQQGTFYGLLKADGELLIRGGADASADLIDVFRAPFDQIEVSVDVGNDVPGTGPTDAFLTTYPASLVKSIKIEAGGGADLINVNTNVNLPTSVDLGAGDDRLRVSGKGLGLGGMMPVSVVGAEDGDDTLELVGERAGDSVIVNAVGVTHTGGFTIPSSGHFEHLEIDTHFGQTDISINAAPSYQDLLIAGGAQDDTIHLNDLIGGLPTRIVAGTGPDTIRLGWAGNGSIYSPVSVFGEGGDDLLEMTDGDLGRVFKEVRFFPGPGVDTIAFHDESSALPGAAYDLGTDSFASPRGFFPLFAPFGDTEVVKVFGDAGDNHFNVAAAAPYRLELHGNRGNDVFAGAGAQAATLFGGPDDDEFVLGNGNLGPSASNVQVFGEAGSDALTLDDSLSALDLPWTIYGATGNNQTDRTVFLGINAYAYGGAFERVKVRGGPAAQTYRFVGGFDSAVDVDTGAGSDTVTLDNIYNQTRSDGTYPIALSGGTGVNDRLVVDDRLGDSADYLLWPTGLFSSDYYQQGVDLTYRAFDNLQVLASGNPTTATVYGTSPDITGQSTVFLGGGTDSAVVYTRDANGDPSIVTTLGIVGEGGTDTVSYIDAAPPGALPAAAAAAAARADEGPGVDWSIRKAPGGTPVLVSGFGGLFAIADDVESFLFVGGVGDDTIDIDVPFSVTALSVNAGAGNDLVRVPNSPGVLAVEGGDGYDQLSETFTLLQALPDRVAVTDAAFIHYRRPQAGSPQFVPAAFTNYSNVEALGVQSRSTVSYLEVIGTRPGAVVTLTGNTGSDSFVVGSLGSSSAIGSAATVDAILGTVTVVGGQGGTDTLTVNDAANAVAKTARLGAADVGSFPGDNLFGPGGRVLFTGIDIVNLNLGAGADTVFAQPNSAAVVNVNAGSGAGDALNLALAGAQDYAVTPGGAPGSGSVTSSNLQSLNYTGVDEPVGIDDAAPEATAAEYVFNAPKPALRVGFSEDVSASLQDGGATFELTNVTTGESIPPGAVQLASYDADNNEVTLTFPGLRGGLLPDGRYTLTVHAGSLSDRFGNRSAGDFLFPFFALAGDFNRDGRVNAIDLGILRRNMRGVVGGLFADGDANYDGRVDTMDLVLLRRKFGTQIDPVGVGGLETGGVEAAAVRAAGGITRRWSGPRRRYT